VNRKQSSEPFPRLPPPERGAIPGIDRWLLRGSPSLRCWLVDIGPSAMGIAFLWVKLIYFSVALHNASWAVKESLALWLHTHPLIFTTTLASLMVLSSLFALCP